jgi:deoxyadenosine/deoxycytidine kinase
MSALTGFIAVAGNIGVGKSSFVELFAARHGWQPVYEAVDENPYLSDFYADMPRWAFPTQVFFLTRRTQQHRQLMRDGGRIIQDRSIYEDAAIFARNLAEQGTLTPRDWQTYRRLYETAIDALTPPSAVLYLRASVPVLLQRIAKRGRAFEQAIPSPYLESLNRLYDEWTAGFALAPVVTVDTDALDFVGRAADLDRVIEALQAAGCLGPKEE